MLTERVPLGFSGFKISNQKGGGRVRAILGTESMNVWRDAKDAENNHQNTQSLWT